MGFEESMIPWVDINSDLIIIYFSESWDIGEEGKTWEMIERTKGGNNRRWGLIGSKIVMRCKESMRGHTTNIRGKCISWGVMSPSWGAFIRSHIIRKTHTSYTINSHSLHSKNTMVGFDSLWVNAMFARDIIDTGSIIVFSQTLW